MPATVRKISPTPQRPQWLIAIDDAWKPVGPCADVHQVLAHVIKTRGLAWLKQQIAADYERVVLTFAQRTLRATVKREFAALAGNPVIGNDEEDEQDEQDEQDNSNAKLAANKNLFARCLYISSQSGRKAFGQWTPDDFKEHASYCGMEATTWGQKSEVALATAKELRKHRAAVLSDYFLTPEDYVAFEQSFL